MHQHAGVGKWAIQDSNLCVQKQLVNTENNDLDNSKKQGTPKSTPFNVEDAQVKYLLELYERLPERFLLAIERLHIK